VIAIIVAIANVFMTASYQASALAECCIACCAGSALPEGVNRIDVLIPMRQQIVVEETVDELQA
jgi:hypothetical protein